MVILLGYLESFLSKDRAKSWRVTFRILPAPTAVYRKPHGFPPFLAIKNPHYLAYHLEYGRPDFIYRASPYLKKHLETPKNSGNTVIIREIICYSVFRVKFLSPQFWFWLKLLMAGGGGSRTCRKRGHKNKNLTVLAWISMFFGEKIKVSRFCTFRSWQVCLQIFLSRLRCILYWYYKPDTF